MSPSEEKRQELLIQSRYNHIMTDLLSWLEEQGFELKSSTELERKGGGNNWAYEWSVEATQIVNTHKWSLRFDMSLECGEELIVHTHLKDHLHETIFRGGGDNVRAAWVGPVYRVKALSEFYAKAHASLVGGES